MEALIQTHLLSPLKHTSKLAYRLGDNTPGRKVRATQRTLLPNRKALGLKAKRQPVPQKTNRFAPGQSKGEKVE